MENTAITAIATIYSEELNREIALELRLGKDGRYHWHQSEDGADTGTSGDDPEDAVEQAKTAWRTWDFRLENALQVGQKVEAGNPGTEDHDAGNVLEISGGMARVGWASGVQTWAAISDLKAVR